jgi:hypothetical protein
VQHDVAIFADASPIVFDREAGWTAGDTPDAADSVFTMVGWPHEAFVA